MFTYLARLFKYSWLNFWRNKWLASIAVGILASSLLVFSLTYFSYLITSHAIDYLKDKIDVAVYFKKDVPEDRILALKESLETLESVKSVKYTSAAQALLNFKEKHSDDKTIAASLAELDSNPFKAMISIKARDPRDYQEIAQYLNSDKFKDIIEKFTYTKNQAVIDKFIKIVKNMEKGALAIALALIFLTVAVTFNTIRLIIYAAKEEIEIMRLVGASNSFIRGPFVLTGALYGIIAAVMSQIILFVVIKLSFHYVLALVPSIDIYHYFKGRFFSIFGWQLLIGIFLGGASSFISAKRYLSV